MFKTKKHKLLKMSRICIQKHKLFILAKNLLSKSQFKKFVKELW